MPKFIVIFMTCLFSLTAVNAENISQLQYGQCIKMVTDTLEGLENQQKCLTKISLFIFDLKEKNRIDTKVLIKKTVGKIEPLPKLQDNDKTENKQELQNNFSNWDVRETTSAMADTNDVYLTVKSKNIVYPRFGSGDYVRLIVRCTENTTAVVITFGGAHMADLQNYGKVEYRLDKDKARSVRMRESTNNRALGLWSGGKAIPFAKRLFNKSNMLIRYTPFGESPNEVNFNIEGLEQVIKPLRKACHW